VLKADFRTPEELPARAGWSAPLTADRTPHAVRDVESDPTIAGKHECESVPAIQQRMCPGSSPARIAKSANLLESCEREVSAAASIVGAHRALSPRTVQQYRAAKIAYNGLQRRVDELAATMEIVTEIYEQQVARS
jgi:hypothetical protein